jgi:hypothetical protein
MRLNAVQRFIRARRRARNEILPAYVLVFTAWQLGGQAHLLSRAPATVGSNEGTRPYRHPDRRW